MQESDGILRVGGGRVVSDLELFSSVEREKIDRRRELAPTRRLCASHSTRGAVVRVCMTSSARYLGPRSRERSDGSWGRGCSNIYLSVGAEVALIYTSVLRLRLNLLATSPLYRVDLVEY